MIDLIVKYIVKLITGMLDKALYLSRKKKQQKETDNAIKNAKQARQNSDAASADFKLKLEQYRKSQRTNLRRSVRKLQRDSAEAGSDHKEAGSSNNGTGKSDKN